MSQVTEQELVILGLAVVGAIQVPKAHSNSALQELIEGGHVIVETDYMHLSPSGIELLREMFRKS